MQFDAKGRACLLVVWQAGLREWRMVADCGSLDAVFVKEGKHKAPPRAPAPQLIFDDKGKLIANYHRTHPYSSCFAKPLPGARHGAISEVRPPLLYPTPEHLRGMCAPPQASPAAGKQQNVSVTIDGVAFGVFTSE
eukprot:gene3054-7071_t